MTIKAIIQFCVQRALGLPRDPIQIDIRDLALDTVNMEGKEIFDSWPWDETKLAEFQSPAPVAGVITFASNVDVIRAVRYIDSTTAANTGPIFNINEVTAAMQGLSDPVGRFKYLPPDGSGNVRIQVEEDADSTFYVLALKRWVDFTTTTYLTESFPIRNALPALIKLVSDGLREYIGIPKQGGGGDALMIALDRENTQTQRDFQTLPRSPYFSDVDSLEDY